MSPHYTLPALCAFVLLFSISNAQPVLKSSNIAPVGFKAYMYPTAAAISPGEPGPDQVWDYTKTKTVAVDTADHWVKVVKASATPFYKLFGKADFTICVSFSHDTLGYAYYVLQPTQLAFIGEDVKSETDNDNFSLPKASIKLPFFYGDSLIAPFQELGHKKDTIRLYYDAWGTLKTPFGTFDKVMRIKTSKPEDPPGAFEYYFWRENPMIPVMEIDGPDDYFFIPVKQ